VNLHDYLAIEIKTWHESREKIDILFWHGWDAIVDSDLASILEKRERKRRIISDLQ
jgi:hypothetical protein